MALLKALAHAPAIRSSRCRLERWLLVVSSFLLWSGLNLSAQTTPSPEYQVKAVFLFNFAQFVDWPSKAFPEPQTPLVIGVLGEDPFGPYLDETVRGEKVNNRPLAVNIGVLAQIVGSNSTAALAFDDPKNAREILAALAAEHQITAAAIYDQKGQIFASFPEALPVGQFPEHPGPDGHKFDRTHLIMFQPILQSGTRL